MRKLASIQEVLEVSPIEGADRIELVKVLGWKVVCKKEEVKKGEKIIYIETDSIMPNRPEFDFLKERKYRIKTMKLKGKISQGLVLPLTYIPDYRPENVYEVGDDVTGKMGIVKYEPPIHASLSGQILGAFPRFLPKTDETRVNVLQSVLDRYKGTVCFITEKLDGSSCSFFVNEGEFGVCSRNLQLKETPENTQWRLARELKLEEKLKSFGKNIAFQGEIVGEGINKNTLKLKGQKIYFFNIYEIDERRYYDIGEFITTLMRLGLEPVPIISDNYILENDMEEIIVKATRKSLINRDGWAEGIVIRPLKEQNVDPEFLNMLGYNRLSFKVVNTEFLIKNE